MDLGVLRSAKVVALDGAFIAVFKVTAGGGEAVFVSSSLCIRLKLPCMTRNSKAPGRIDFSMT